MEKTTGAAIGYNVTCVTICDYHDEKKKEKKNKFVPIYNADCFASA